MPHPDALAYIHVSHGREDTIAPVLVSVRRLFAERMFISLTFTYLFFATGIPEQTPEAMTNLPQTLRHDAVDYA